jgi:ElaB/YqjD/DUF883 family membrane-anchored ribosome-binding protein
MEVTTRANIHFPTGNGTAGDTSLNRAIAGVHGAVDKVAGVADDAARKVKPAIDRATEVAHQTVDKVAGVAAPTATWLSEQGDSLKASQRTMVTDAGQYVSAHPWKSLGFALVAGFLISRTIG